MSTDFIARLIGMVGFAIGGLYLGVSLSVLAEAGPRELWAMVFALVGALLGLVVTPFLTTRPIRAARRLFSRLPAQTLAAALMGLIGGLIVGALVSLPLSLLPPPFANFLPLVSAALFGYFGVALFVLRQNDVFAFLSLRFSGASPAAGAEGHTILLDTSVIIDGRVADVAATGFLQATLLVPRFVLNELQYIADSADAMRRQRGRRGLDILNRLQKDRRAPLRITDLDVEDVRSADEKLVILAKQLRCPILTNDYNLNRVAELQGVTVLNLNELANALRAIFLPGESLEVRVIQEGKEAGQGVGYLEDGTMVVVDEGRRHIDRTIPIVVTKVLQTTAGRMIFARVDSSVASGNAH